MDPAPDPLGASAPFPTIPAVTPSARPRVAKPRRQAAPFRSDHPVASSSPSRRPGGEFPSFAWGAAGPSSRPSTAGSGPAGSRPAAFIFGGDAASSRGVGVEENPASVSSWSSSRDAKFVFGSGLSGASEVKRNFSFGSGDASLSSISATVEELILDGSSGKRSDADADVSRGNDSVLEMNAGDSFGARESSLNLHEDFCPRILHGEAEQLDEGRGVQSQTETISLAARVVNSTICTDKNVPMEFAKDGGNSSVRDSADEGNSAKDGSKISGHRRFAANTVRSDIKNVDSSDKENVTYSSEQLYPSASEDSACTKLQPARGSSNRDPPHLGPHEIPETEKASNTTPFSFGSQDDSAKVSYTKLSDGMETQSTVVATSGLGECGSFDEKSFTVHDHNATSRDKGWVKGMNMNRRAVKPKKVSAHQVSSLQTVFTSDCFSGKVAPEINFRLEDSGICIGDCGPEEADAMQTTESRHDGTGFTFAADLENSGQSDFTFASCTFDHSKLHSQRRHNKKSCGGMGNHANSVQSLPTSAIGLAHSEVSASKPSTALAAQWTEYSKAEPKTLTVSSGPTCTKTEYFGYQEDCETWRLRGNQAYAEGQLAKAEECYTHGINTVSPNEASRKALMLCYSNRAATLMSLGRMREALSDCRKATDIDSSFLKAQVRAANCLLALGDVEEAQKGFEMCLKSNHAASLDHKIVEEASDGLQKAQKVSSLMLQSKEYLVKKSFDKIPSALQMISDALSISIYSDNLMMMKAEALLLLRRYEEVIRFCEETLHLAERNSVSVCPDEHSKNIILDSYSCSVKLWRYYLIAKSYFFIGKLEEAHQFLKKHEQAALVEYMCGKQSQQSVSSFSMAISELLRLKTAGNEAFQAGKYSEAVEHYTAALLNNTESLHFSAICFGNRAAAYQAMGQILDAIADCSLAIALDTNYSKAISRRASLYERIRDYGQAGNDLRFVG